MEIDTLSGLPAHPLFVHIPVVLVPLAASAAVILVVFPQHIRRFGWWVAGFAGIGALGAILAAGSGEALEDRVEETAALERHTDLGEVARTVSILLFVVLVALVLGHRLLIGRRLRRALAVVVVGAVSVGAVATIAGAGHSGAESVWSDVVDGSNADREFDENDD